MEIVRIFVLFRYAEEQQDLALLSISTFQRALKVSCLVVACTSVADPDPPDPRVSGPPGSGSGSFLLLSKNIKKNLDFYYFVTSF
jgi:hypothetical protein